MHVFLLEPTQSTWSSTVAHLYALLGGAANPTLFPLHFLQAVLHRIGGHIALAAPEANVDALQAVVFLFPRPHSTANEAPTRTYTARLHVLSAPVEWAALDAALRRSLPAATFFLYDPAAAHDYLPTHQLQGVVDIGQPDQHEALAIRRLQQQVWGSPPEYLYPADIHSAGFALGASLVARRQEEPIGFLFGFHKFGGYPLPVDWRTRFGGDRRLESQALGVLPAERAARVGFLLKKAQATDALHQGIQLINWTVDPLQWPNALLNFGLLRAVAFDFTPDYYPFRNELNRVAASRFSLTWLVATQRVQQSLTTGAKQLLDLSHWPTIERINAGAHLLTQTTNAAQIAIEIPANWTALQAADLDAAQQWRTATDQIFQRFIGLNPSQYVVTDVAVDGEHCYLIAAQAGDHLWAHLAE